MSWSFATYRDAFERRVVVEGVRTGCLGRPERVPVNVGRFSRQAFGRKMGGTVKTDGVCVVDYYGHMKRSSGFVEMVRELRAVLPGSQIKMVEVPVVHFAGIRLEKVARLAHNLVAWFPMFKKEVLDARGFKHNYEV